MRFMESAELHKHTKHGIQWTGALMGEAFRLHNVPINLTWVNRDKLESVCLDYAINHGWNPETTFVWYSHTLSGTASDIDVLTTLNPGTCACMLFENMTLEKLIGIIDQVTSLRAFL